MSDTNFRRFMDRVLTPISLAELLGVEEDARLAKNSCLSKIMYAYHAQRSAAGDQRLSLAQKAASARRRDKGEHNP